MARRRRRRRRGYTTATEKALERRLKQLGPKAGRDVRSTIKGVAEDVKTSAQGIVPVGRKRRRPTPYALARAGGHWTNRHIRDAIRVSMRRNRPFARVGLVTRLTRMKHWYHVFIAAGSAGYYRSRHGPRPFMDLALIRRGRSGAAKIRKAYITALERHWSR